jgi:PTHB1 C-terminus
MHVLTLKGWEESVDTALTYLLKTSLAKNAKETAILPATAIEVNSSTLRSLICFNSLNL